MLTLIVPAALVIVAIFAAYKFCDKDVEQEPEKETWSEITMTEIRAMWDYPTAVADAYIAYIKDKADIHPRQRLAEWQKEHPCPFASFSIAGINFRKGIKDFIGDIDVTLEADPKNPYDENAIKITETNTGHHIGFIRAEETEEVRSMTALPARCRCRIEENEDYDEGRIYYTGIVKIRIN